MSSLLGRRGGVARVNGEGRSTVGFDGKADTGEFRMAPLACRGGDPSRVFSSLKLWEDFRGGGLGGLDASVAFFLTLTLSLPSASLTVEFEDEEVRDSRTAARP